MTKGSGFGCELNFVVHPLVDQISLHHALDTYIYVLLSIFVRSAMNLTRGGVPTKLLMSTEQGVKLAPVAGNL